MCSNYSLQICQFFPNSFLFLFAGNFSSVCTSQQLPVNTLFFVKSSNARCFPFFCKFLVSSSCSLCSPQGLLYNYDDLELAVHQVQPHGIGLQACRSDATSSSSFMFLVWDQLCAQMQCVECFIMHLPITLLLLVLGTDSNVALLDIFIC